MHLLYGSILPKKKLRLHICQAFRGSRPFAVVYVFIQSGAQFQNEGCIFRRRGIISEIPRAHGHRDKTLRSSFLRLNTLLLKACCSIRTSEKMSIVKATREVVQIEELQHHAPKQLTRKSSSNHRESTRKSAHVHVSGNHDRGHPLQGPRPRLQTSGCRGRCVYARDPSCLATWSHGRMAVDLGRSVSAPFAAADDGVSCSHTCTEKPILGTLPSSHFRRNRRKSDAKVEPNSTLASTLRWPCAGYCSRM